MVIRGIKTSVIVLPGKIRRNEKLSMHSAPVNTANAGRIGSSIILATQDTLTRIEGS